MVTKEVRKGDKTGVWDLWIHITVYRIDNQQGLTVQRRINRYILPYIG